MVAARPRSAEQASDASAQPRQETTLAGYEVHDYTATWRFNSGFEGTRGRCDAAAAPGRKSQMVRVAPKHPIPSRAEPKVLVGAFDYTFAQMLASLLGALGYSALRACDRRATWDVLMRVGPDLVLLPLERQEGEPTIVLSPLRAAGDWTPVIVLGGPDAAGRAAEVLDAGADDYLARPFDPREFRARVRAILRRARTGRVLVRGGGRVVIDPTSHALLIDGRGAGLSAREFSVVWVLTSHSGRAVATTELARAVLGTDSKTGRAQLHVLVTRLRRKLRALGDAVTIETVVGGGTRSSSAGNRTSGAAVGPSGTSEQRRRRPRCWFGSSASRAGSNLTNP